MFTRWRRCMILPFLVAVTLLSGCQNRNNGVWNQAPENTSTTAMPQDNQLVDTPAEHPIELRAASPRIFPHSWSPDGNFLAYWTFTAAEVAEDYKYPPGTLNFLNMTTGETCAYPDEIYYYGAQFSWVAPAQFLAIVYGANNERSRVLLNTPCLEEAKEVGDLAAAAIVGIAPPRPKLSQLLLESHDGCWLYEAQTQSARKLAMPRAKGCTGTWSPSATHVVYTDAKSVGESVMATTYLVNTNTDREEGRMEWAVRLGKGEAAPLIWLNEETVLIPETLDQGPLLLTVGQGSTQVAPALFHVETLPGQRAFAVVDEKSKLYHMVLTQEEAGLSLEPKNEFALLYNSATSQVVALPFQTMVGFSPDRQWAYGFNTTERGVYLWPLDGDGKQPLRLPLAQDSFNNKWNPDSTQIATAGYGEILIFALPSGEQVDRIPVDGYSAEPFGWSPDGRFFAIRGVGPKGEALFVAQMKAN